MSEYCLFIAEVFQTKKVFCSSQHFTFVLVRYNLKTGPEYPTQINKFWLNYTNWILHPLIWLVIRVMLEYIRFSVLPYNYQARRLFLLFDVTTQHTIRAFFVLYKLVFQMICILFVITFNVKCAQAQVEVETTETQRERAFLCKFQLCIIWYLV